MSTPSYDRAPSDEMKALLSPKGFLAPLVGLTSRRVNGLELDVHLRVNDEVQIYCGLTRVLNVRRNRNGTVSVSAHQTYSRQDSAKAILRRWHTDEVDEFRRALDAYLDSVNVSKRHTATEGAVQSMWSRVTYPWIPFDREAVLSYSAEEGSRKAREFKQVELAGTEVSLSHKSPSLIYAKTGMTIADVDTMYWCVIRPKVSSVPRQQESPEDGFGRRLTSETASAGSNCRVPTMGHATCRRWRGRPNRSRSGRPTGDRRAQGRFCESRIGLLHTVSDPALHMGMAHCSRNSEERVAGIDRRASGVGVDTTNGSQAHRRHSGRRLLWSR